MDNSIFNAIFNISIVLLIGYFVIRLLFCGLLVEEKKKDKDLECTLPVFNRISVDAHQYQCFVSGLQPYIIVNIGLPYHEGDYLYLMEVRNGVYTGGNVLVTIHQAVYDREVGETGSVILFLSRVKSLPAVKE